MLDQTLEQSALFGRQVTVVETHVAEKDDIELGKLLSTGGKLLNVVLVAAAHFAQTRMEQQTPYIHARIARQGIAEITVLPARQRFHDQHAQLLFPNGDRRQETIVVALRLIRV